MATLIGLPRYAVLKAMDNHKYVQITNDNVDGSLRVNVEHAVIPQCKFQLEMAQAGNGLLNIRSCYNNKYWVRESQTEGYLKAGADVPNEDRSHWSCTLFEPIRDDNATLIQLRCVYTQKLVSLYNAPPPHSLSVYTDSDGTGHTWQKWTVMDWESLLILPKRVVFKGDNEHYLRVDDTGHPWLKFQGKDIRNPSVVNQITNAPGGCVRIKSEDTGKFWRRSPNWIWADSDDYSNDNKDTLFMPVKAGANINMVALRNLGNNHFCKRLTQDGNTDRLNACVSSITWEATLIVEEPVYSRSIYNVKFRLADARIYDEKIVTMVTKDVANHNTEPETQELKLTYTQTTSSTWDRSVSLKLGIATSITAGVPLIAEEKIDISVEAEGSLSWSDTKETSLQMESDQIVTVRPMSRVKASVVATQGKCDVPFSYTQRDVLTNGETVIYEMDDGIYSGINSYNFHYETTNEPL